MWYVIHLFVDLDKFLARYYSLSTELRERVREVITFRKPNKAMYQRDLGMFVGYVFVQIDAPWVGLLQKELKANGLGEILTSPGGRHIMPLGADEVQWIYRLLQSRTESHLQHGCSVRIKEGPFEGMIGTIEAVAGPDVSVRVPLHRSVSIAHCTADTVEAA